MLPWVIAIALALPGPPGRKGEDHRRTAGQAPLNDTTDLTAKPADVSLTRASSAWIEGSDGQWTEVTSGNTSVQSDGLDAWEGTTNEATNCLDYSAWTDIGTPTVSTDQDSGPFAAYNGSAEADLVGDDNASGFEGQSAPALTSVTGDYTLSMLVKANTSTEFMLDLLIGGVSNQCHCTSLDTTPSCSVNNGSPTCGYDATEVAGYYRLWATATAAAENVTPRYFLGNAISDTGNVYLSCAQVEASSYPTRPCVTAGTAATCASDQFTIATTNWPLSRGRILFAYTPGDDGGYARVLLDTVTSDEGVTVHIDASDQLVVTTADGATPTTTTSAALTWSAGTQYQLDVRWGAGTVVAYRDGALVASGTGKDIPTAHAANAALCSNVAGSSQCNGRLAGLRVFR